MENTARVLFDDDKPQWYLASGEAWVGPLTAADVYAKVVAGEISWAHFVWKPGQNEWKRICDIKTFQAAVPMLPGKQVQSAVKQAAKPTVKQSARKTAGPPPSPTRGLKAVEAGPPEDLYEQWYLHYEDSQFGPFSREEVGRFLRVGRVNRAAYAWKEGMDGWQKIEKIAVFSEAVEVSKKFKIPTGSARSEKRDGPRRPLVAKILLSNDESVITALCRDISVGGMQVLTDRIPGPVGTRVKLNVSPSGAQSNFTQRHIQPFVAEGEIVRILEDGRGFSFRFEKISEQARDAIIQYIQSTL